MHLAAVGLNHRTAPIDLREQVALSDRRLPDSLRAFIARPAIVEAVILSTCNRTEIYATIDSAAPGAPSSLEHLLTESLAALGGVGPAQFSGHVYHYRDERAASHLMRVTAGLDSMILGEHQILGQVKTAYEVARSAGATGASLNMLFQSALSLGKRVRSETAIGQGAFSVGAAAVELATRIFGDSLAGKTVLVLGAGKMSEVTARHLQSRGAPAVLVTNRTFDRAESLARQLGSGASAMRFDDLHRGLLQSDIVICSTAAPHPVVTRELISQAMRARRNRPLFLVDIAVPRDVETAVGEMPSVYLYNIDDLGEVVARDQSKRQDEVARVQIMIDDAVGQYQAWRRSLEVVPLVSAVRDRLDGLRLEELARVRARLPHLPERELRVIEIALQSITGKVAHDALIAIKNSAAHGADPSAYDRLDAIRAAFGLGDGLEDATAAMSEPSTQKARDRLAGEASA